jgi:thermitase
MTYTRIFLMLVVLVILPSLLLAQGNHVQAFSNRTAIVKFKAESKFVTGSAGTVQTGQTSIDRIFSSFGVVESRPMFPPENADLQLRQALGMDRIYVLSLTQSSDISAMVAQLAQDPAVEYATPDYVGSAAGVELIDSVIPNDTYFNRQWGFRNTGAFPTGDTAKAGADIKAIYAWAITKGDTSIIVGVLDSGVKWDHPDFGGRIWVNKGEIAGNGIDDDANGYKDDVRGWNFAYNNNNVMDDEGHGTNVASIIGAKANNSKGYAGLDWYCRIMPLKILDSNGNGYYSWWSSAMYYAANNGARVLNISAGGTSSDQTMETALRYAYQKGCFIVASMANSNDSTKYYPAAYDTLVVAVGATDCQDRRVNKFAWSPPGGGSCYGSWIDVCAPGNKIYGVYNKDTTSYGWYWSGTSQASPMVAGLASLLLAQDHTRTPRQLCNIIRATADDQVGRPSEDKKGFDVFHGFGRINCYKALTYNPNDVPHLSLQPPGSFALYGNYPNPFNPSTSISYQLSATSVVSLKIFDAIGREVATLVHGTKPPGQHIASWDARGYSSGVYFCRLQALHPSTGAPLFAATTKLVLLK